MAYEPKTWVCGETITAEALNHIEDGLAECCGGSAVVVRATAGTCPDDPDKGAKFLDKTWNEIKAAYDAGLNVYLEYFQERGNEEQYWYRECLTQLFNLSDEQEQLILWGVTFAGDPYDCSDPDAYPFACDGK